MKNGHALHVYFGDGKGKTTAGMGLAIRAAGQGRRVLLSQFMKTNNTGELNSLARIDNITVVLGRPIAKLTSRMTPEELAEEKRKQHDNFELICREIERIEPQTIVLDELAVAVHMGFVSEDEVLQRVDTWLETAEVVLTGHWCCEAIRERADYVTEMVKRKHPFDHGVTARRGVEF